MLISAIVDSPLVIPRHKLRSAASQRMWPLQPLDCDAKVRLCSTIIELVKTYFRYAASQRMWTMQRSLPCPRYSFSWYNNRVGEDIIFRGQQVCMSVSNSSAFNIETSEICPIYSNLDLS